VELVEEFIDWQYLWDSEVPKVLQLKATQMLDAYYYFSVVIVLVFTIYLPLSCFDQIERHPSKLLLLK
jgi:hypothetical protein